MNNQTQLIDKETMLLKLSKKYKSLDPKDFMKSAKERLSMNIHSNDGMITDSPYYYFMTGVDACVNIKKALDKENIDSSKIKRILDLPCGYGRVSRWFNVFFPSARLYVSDIMKDATQYCVDNFNGIQIDSTPEPEDLVLPKNVDLIWVGSLFTHLPEQKVMDLLRKMTSCLSKDGIIVFTLHGDYVVNRITEREKVYNLSEKNVKALLDRYDRKGFGFATYPNSKHYGISVYDKNWLYFATGLINDLDVAHIWPKGWVAHQDIVVARKSKGRYLPAGKKYYCPCCEISSTKFKPMNKRENAICPKCSSLERNRLAYFFLKERTDLFQKNNFKLLHVAPEKVLSDEFKEASNITCLQIANKKERRELEGDLLNLKYKDNSIDGIICNNVLQHIPDDTAVIKELLRVLKKGGWAMLQVPTFRSFKHTQENLSSRSNSPYDKSSKNRIYGYVEYPEKLTKLGFRVVVEEYARKAFTEKEIQRFALLKSEQIFFCVKK